MIFVTVGTQLGFDRLIRAVDQWAGAHKDLAIFAQIGPGKYHPVHMQSAAFLSPSEAAKYMREAECIVSHAGMGTVLTALQIQKPILIMPRKADIGEHRNDHQMATAKWLDGREGIQVAWTENDVSGMLDNRAEFGVAPPLSDRADGELVQRLSKYIGSL